MITRMQIAAAAARRDARKSLDVLLVHAPDRKTVLDMFALQARKGCRLWDQLGFPSCWACLSSLNLFTEQELASFVRTLVIEGIEQPETYDLTPEQLAKMRAPARA